MNRTGFAKEALPEDGRQIKRTAPAFRKARLAGNTEAMRQYLSGDFQLESVVIILYK